MTKEDVASFFMECTAENVRWRKHIKQKLDDAIDPTEFHNLSRLALSYAIGLPTKAQIEAKHRESLIFLTTHGYVPWDARAPAAASMNARSVRMIEGKAEEITLQAETRAAEVVIDAKVDNETDLEPLESVNPDAFNPGGGKR
jgi:hypothetical protein